jgi:hypothetical protein
MSSNRQANWDAAQARNLGQQDEPSPLIRSRERTSFIIPFEHNLVYRLTGRRGARQTQVLQVSTQGEFVIDTISYFVDIFTGFIAAGQVPPLLAGGVRTLGCEFASETIRFLFNITDASSGRRLQNDALHNISIFGTPGQTLPRNLPRPWRFAPRTEVRVEIEELFSILHEKSHLLVKEASQFRELHLVTGRLQRIIVPVDLHITFHGHKILRT